MMRLLPVKLDIVRTILAILLLLPLAATAQGPSAPRLAPAQAQAQASLRTAVREIRTAGYTARDAGMLLGLSNQRISQIEHEE